MTEEQRKFRKELDLKSTNIIITDTFEYTGDFLRKYRYANYTIYCQSETKGKLTVFVIPKSVLTN